MSTPTPRNAPCPCGSGLRYKECHGKLGSEPFAAPPVARLVERALQAHQQGRVEEAERGYRQALEREPGNAIATHYLGLIAWHRGDPASAERAMRASIAADGSVPDFHNNLGLLLRDTGRTQDAIDAFGQALLADPTWYEAHSNRALALEDAGRPVEAEASCRAAIAAEPRFAAAQQNLARLLLLQGRFAEGWDRYRWRLLAQGLARELPDPVPARLPDRLGGKRIALRAEQGLGDVLFFLRFAPELVRRGATLAFRGDARLHPILARTGLFALGCEADAAPFPDLEPIFAGDLPGLLGADDPARLPPALPLTTLPERVASMRERLAAAGPTARVALTWRSGVMPVGPARTRLKEASLESIGAALKGTPATWISVQRGPRAGEHDALASALGAAVHDFSAVNDDLEDMLALLSLVDGYVGTSNANTHLAAGLGKSQHVLVPDPPEWRWMAASDRSPWFPGMRIYRPMRGQWVLDGLVERLRAGFG